MLNRQLNVLCNEAVNDVAYRDACRMSEAELEAIHETDPHYHAVVGQLKKHPDKIDNPYAMAHYLIRRGTM
jgi:hypothetical protein